jgi:hypothetical protein
MEEWTRTYSGLEYPLIPMRLFKNIAYDANIACASLAAIVYYANSIIWPTMVSSLFTTDVTEIGWLSVRAAPHPYPITANIPHSVPSAAVF